MKRRAADPFPDDKNAASGWSRRKILRWFFRGIIAIAVIALAFVIWTVVGVWLEFRSIESINVDVDNAREAILQLKDEERPTAPPVEIDDPPVEPQSSDLSTTTTTLDAMVDEATTTTTHAEPTTTTTKAPDIEGDQLPYDPNFSTSPPIPNEAFNAFLLIGSDAREDGIGIRADVIMLALLPQNDDPMLVSIPRDLWLPNPCWKRARRVNTSLRGCGNAASGPELLALTVANYTGIQADHFALFNFDDFTRVIDAFGGITICVDNPTKDKKWQLPAGCSEADGETTLGWVRSRKTKELVNGRWKSMSGVSDLTRNERQRDVIIKLLGKVKSLDTFTSLVEIAGSISDAVTIDDGITITDAIGIAWDLRNVTTSNISKIAIPIRHYVTDGGAAVLVPTKSFDEILAEYWNPNTPNW